MTAHDFQRARTPQQQEERRRAILAVARDLVDEAPLLEISLRELARRVGLAKSNVVRYFPTREAVFLAVLAEDWHDWLDDLATDLPGPDRRRSAHTTHGRIAVSLAATLAARPRLCGLIAAAPLVLEQNIPFEVAHDFKSQAMANHLRLAGLLRAAAPRLSEEAGFAAAGATWALVSGAWPVANPSPVVARVLAEPELAPMRIEFVPSFTGVFTALLDGLAAS